MLEENKLIAELAALLRAILEYEAEQKEFNNGQDQEYQAVIDKFMREQHLLAGEVEKEKEKQREKTVAKMEEHERKVVLLKKRLYQIFLFYCRDNKPVGITFEDMGRTAQLIDLRIFLKYFKDYQYSDINKYRFKATTATNIFRSSGTNGLTLTFEQFWEVHRQLFDLQDLGITRRDIVEGDLEALLSFCSKWELEIEKLKEFNQIVSEDRTKSLLKFSAVKTESSPEKSLSNKNPSTVMVESKVSSNFSSNFPRKKAFSELEGQLINSRNFIQRVRAELVNAEEGSSRVKISRYNSLSIF